MALSAKRAGLGVLDTNVTSEECYNVLFECSGFLAVLLLIIDLQSYVEHRAYVQKGSAEGKKNRVKQ